MIVQNVSVSGKTDFTFTVSDADRSAAEKVLKEKMVNISYDELIIDEDIAKVSLVGVGMRSHAGIASTASTSLPLRRGPTAAAKASERGPSSASPAFVAAVARPVFGAH